MSCNTAGANLGSGQMKATVPAGSEVIAYWKYVCPLQRPCTELTDDGVGRVAAPGRTRSGPLWYIWRTAMETARTRTRPSSSGCVHPSPRRVTSRPADDLYLRNLQFKIDEKGLISGDLPTGDWAQGQLIADNSSWTVTIPASLAPGEYMLRHEVSTTPSPTRGH